MARAGLSACRDDVIQRDRKDEGRAGSQAGSFSMFRVRSLRQAASQSLQFRCQGLGPLRLLLGPSGLLLGPSGLPLGPLLGLPPECHFLLGRGHDSQWAGRPHPTGHLLVAGHEWLLDFGGRRSRV